MQRWKAVIFLYFVVGCSGVLAEEVTFALLAKSVNDHNFQEAWRGCQELAVSNGNTCVLLGPSGSASPRAQLQALKDGLEQYSVSALAISVTHSALLAHFCKNLNIPIFSFDSPFSERYSSISQGYIGIDNFEFGKRLGRLAQQYRPKGGTLCLMSAENDPNLQLRMQGVRAQLSGKTNWPEHKRLQNHGGWTEVPRCPWDSGDSVKRSIRQLKTTLTEIHPDLFISVGHWPILNPEQLITSLSSVKRSSDTSQTILLVATGIPDSDQLQLVHDGMIDGFVSIDFYTMGRQVANAMNNALNNSDQQSHEVSPPFRIYSTIPK